MLKDAAEEHRVIESGKLHCRIQKWRLIGVDFFAKRVLRSIQELQVELHQLALPPLRQF
jgi:hypothetical protein